MKKLVQLLNVKYLDSLICKTPFRKFEIAIEKYQIGWTRALCVLIDVQY